jgi:hypothetical protein
MGASDLASRRFTALALKLGQAARPRGSLNATNASCTSGSHPRMRLVVDRLGRRGPSSGTPENNNSMAATATSATQPAAGTPPPASTNRWRARRARTPTRPRAGGHATTSRRPEPFLALFNSRTRLAASPRVCPNGRRACQDDDHGALQPPAERVDECATAVFEALGHRLVAGDRRPWTAACGSLSAVTTTARKPPPAETGDALDYVGMGRIPRRPVEEFGEAPRRPGLYVLYGGTGAYEHAVYVGVATNLRTRLQQHFIRRDSSVVTGTSAAGLNIDRVRAVQWWEDPLFADKVRREAAEIVGFGLFNPALRSRGSSSAAARELARKAQFVEEVQAILRFGGTVGRVELPTLTELAESVRWLAGRVDELEATVAELTAQRPAG